MSHHRHPQSLQDLHPAQSGRHRPSRHGGRDIDRRCRRMCGPDRRVWCRKSTLMRMIWGNYLAASGSLTSPALDVATATPREIIALRRDRMGYVSQFLRVVPRVPTLDVVAEPSARPGHARGQGPRCRGKRCFVGSTSRNGSGPFAHHLLGRRTAARQHRPWLCRHAPALLLDEPTASLDAANREVVLTLIEEAKARRQRHHRHLPR
jgi:alpha-D-ribose 1-methylphosphonate 5-triphosphate synthase subunit PhnL